MKKSGLYKLLWMALFAISMAYLESAIVVYLRELYYPDGFAFPLKMIDYRIALIEFFREIATIIMLAGIGIIASKKNMERFAWFLIAFAIWDIFYYLFLKIMLGWPESFITWDVLFFVPVTWVGPVIAPVINSLVMILLALVIINRSEKTGIVRTGLPLWLLLIGGSVVVIISYTEEYTRFMLQRFEFHELWGVSASKELVAYGTSFVPAAFNWYLFFSGVIMHIAGIILIIRKNRTTKAERIKAPSAPE